MAREIGMRSHNDENTYVTVAGQVSKSKWITVNGKIRNDHRCTMPVYFGKQLQDIDARGNRGRHFDKAVEAMAPTINGLKSSGIHNIRQLMRCLNKKGLLAPTGGPFTYGTTHRVLKRLRELHLGSGPRTRSQAASQRLFGPYTYRAGNPLKLFNSLKLKRAMAQHSAD
jgi:hypothetical protein